MTTLSPMLAQQIKNSQNLQAAATVQQALPAVKNENMGDVLAISKKPFNKKKAIGIGIIAASAMALCGTLFFAARRGKVVNADSSQETKLFNNIKEGFKTFVGEGKENYKAIINKNKQVDPPVPPIETKPPKDIPKAEDLGEELERKAGETLEMMQNPKLLKGGHYQKTPVCLDETSVEADMQKWVEKVKSAPLEVELKNSQGKMAYLNNPIDTDKLSKIKPHDYEETADIIIQTKGHHSGFTMEGFGIVDGQFGQLEKGSFSDYSNCLDKKIDGNDMKGYSAGISKDGKAYVKLLFNGIRVDRANRPIQTEVILQSKNGNFTKDQLDAIKMFENIDEKLIRSRSGEVFCPLNAAFLIENEGSELSTSLFFNKNTFLSILKDCADKFGNFNTEEFLNKNNGAVSRVLI